MRITTRATGRLELARAAGHLRNRLLPMLDVPVTREDQYAADTRAAARAAAQEFWSAVPLLDRRARRLAQYWENAAAMAYWHRKDEYRAAEELGARLLADLPARGCRGTAVHDLQDACDEAQELYERNHPGELDALLKLAGLLDTVSKNQTDLATTTRVNSADSPNEPHDTPPPADGATGGRRRRLRRSPDRAGRRARSPFVDQAELIRRMEQERTSLRLESLIGDSSGRAMRQYDPWLVGTLTTLQNPMTTTELEELVAEWRRRRQPFSFLNPEMADVVIVEPLDRRQDP
jgi:hypothetical protein